VAGQSPDYSARRLHEYRDGRIWYRDRHAFDTMAQVAAPLTDVEIAALASYLEGLHPRGDDPAPAR
jgi:cytochrome c553